MVLSSLSARRAWIEIFEWIKHKYPGCVALRKESVDRNIMIITICIALKKSLSARRAWIEILGSRLYDMSAAWSLSARRAWIEMLIDDVSTGGKIVALRKESVDRNTSIDNLTQGVFKSLSARRAWIEINTRNQPSKPRRVALRKESVDRNWLRRLCGVQL